MIWLNALRLFPDAPANRLVASREEAAQILMEIQAATGMIVDESAVSYREFSDRTFRDFANWLRREPARPGLSPRAIVTLLRQKTE